MVYGFAVIKRVTGLRASPLHGFTCSLVPPPLARVNRLLRREIIPEYYAKNEFWIQLPITKDDFHDAFFARCEIASEFIPMIKSLCAEVCTGENATWSIMFEAAEPDSPQGVHMDDTVIPGHSIYGQPRPEIFYWRMLAKMLKTMKLDQLLSYGDNTNITGNKQAIDHCVVSDALHMLTKRSCLAQIRLEAVFCEL